ncbi:MAG: hypothetical protein ACQ9MH_17605 [Nitrospinales bacterium]
MTDIGGGYNMKFLPSGETESATIFLPFDAEAKLEGDGGIQKNLLTELVECEPRKAKSPSTKIIQLSLI